AGAISSLALVPGVQAATSKAAAVRASRLRRRNTGCLQRLAAVQQCGADRGEGGVERAEQDRVLGEAGGGDLGLEHGQVPQCGADGAGERGPTGLADLTGEDDEL